MKKKHFENNLLHSHKFSPNSSTSVSIPNSKRMSLRLRHTFIKIIRNKIQGVCELNLLISVLITEL